MRLPGTAAGSQASWVLEHLGRPVGKREIQRRFSASFLHAVSPRKVQAVFLSMRAQLPLSVVAVRGDDHRLDVDLDGPRGSWGMRIAVDRDEPHLIAGLLIRPAGPVVHDAVRQAEACDDVEALLERHIEPFATSGGDVAGAVCAVAHHDATTSRAYGAVAEDGVFEIGSITKAVTATLLAEMAASGDVRLEDAVDAYLPSGCRPPAADPPITLLELATHSAGLPRLPVNLDVADPDDPYATWTVDALFDGLAATPVDGRGTVAYSNLGYALLGQVLARAAASSYDELVRSLVLTPYGMRGAGMRSQRDLDGRRVRGHRGGEAVPSWTGTAIAPAGGIEATVGDVLAFAVAHAGAEAGSPAASTHQGRLPRGNGTHVGLGWIVVETPNGDVLWHNGGTGGFRSFVGFHPSSRSAVAVLTNTAEAVPDVPAATVLGALVAAS